jgi:hypothetical protein
MDKEEVSKGEYVERAAKISQIPVFEELAKLVKLAWKGTKEYGWRRERKTRREGIGEVREKRMF